MFGICPPGFRNVGRGVLREYILVKHDDIFKVPDNISLKDAACLPCAGIHHHYFLHLIYFPMLIEFLGYTSYYFLVEKAKLKQGDRVFINGGSGAVGVMAIQLARTIVGSTGLVVATCSSAKIDIIRNLGADEVFFFFI